MSFFLLGTLGPGRLYTEAGFPLPKGGRNESNQEWGETLGKMLPVLQGPGGVAYLGPPPSHTPLPPATVLSLFRGLGVMGLTFIGLRVEGSKNEEEGQGSQDDLHSAGG